MARIINNNLPFNNVEVCVQGELSRSMVYGDSIAVMVARVGTLMEEGEYGWAADVQQAILRRIAIFEEYGV